MTMTEYKTLSEWMGDMTRGDGRKFTNIIHTFEPLHKDKDGFWHGVAGDGLMTALHEDTVMLLPMISPPKKKVKLYQWAFRGDNGWVAYDFLFKDEMSFRNAIPNGHCYVCMRLDYSVIEVNETDLIFETVSRGR